MHASSYSHYPSSAPAEVTVDSGRFWQIVSSLSSASFCEGSKSKTICTCDLGPRGFSAALFVPTSQRNTLESLGWAPRQPPNLSGIGGLLFLHPLKINLKLNLTRFGETHSIEPSVLCIPLLDR